MFLDNKKIIVRAPLLSYSGYGTHSRQVFKFVRTHFPNSHVTTGVLPWGITSWMVNPELCNGDIGDIMSLSAPSTGDEKFDISFQVQLPNEWDPTLAKFNIGISAVVETDICNPKWLDACNRMDLIIVPSQHAANALNNSGYVETPIEVVGECFYPEIENNPPPLDVEFETSFNFLLVGQFTGQHPTLDRKNIFNTLKWFVEEFTGDEEVGLVLKTNVGTNTIIDKKLTHDTVEKVLSEVRKGDYPKVHVIHGPMSTGQIARLYKHPTVKAFLSLTRGEGFGLPILEAAASGLPVITTNWSGHLDFLRLGKFIGVPYHLADVPDARIDNEIFMPTSKWAEVDENMAKRVMRKFYNSSHKPQGWALDLQPRIHENFSERAIFARYKEVLERFL